MEGIGGPAQDCRNVSKDAVPKGIKDIGLPTNKGALVGHDPEIGLAADRILAAAREGCQAHVLG